MGALYNFPLKEIVDKHHPQIACEAGLGWGTGVYELRKYPFSHIFSVEINKEQVDLLSRVFRFDNRIKIINSLTVDFFKNLLPQIPLNVCCLYFLDSHYPNADIGLADFDEEKDENIRMPLASELKIIKELRADKGAKDIILIDDISLYDDSDRIYDADHKKKDIASKLLPKLNRNYLPQIIKDFEITHNHSILTQEEGYLILEPK